MLDTDSLYAVYRTEVKLFPSQEKEVRHFIVEDDFSGVDKFRDILEFMIHFYTEVIGDEKDIDSFRILSVEFIDFAQPVWDIDP